VSDIKDLLSSWSDYRDARKSLLGELGIPQSYRDPLSEFAEVLVARLVDGELASNRVQKGWDVQEPDGSRIQVKYLANTSAGSWVNWHTVEPNEQQDWWALVIYLDLSPVAVHMFPSSDLTLICKALGKRHGNQSCNLQFTKTCHEAISNDPEMYEALGMRVFLL
jgi:hypothetical protein